MPIITLQVKYENVTKSRLKKPGRPPLGRKAMTNAQRQRKWRSIRRKRRTRSNTPGSITAPDPTYWVVKRALQAQGHAFIGTRRSLGFEHGLFLDGALVSSSEVIELARLSLIERDEWLAERRAEHKLEALWMVKSYMDELHVTLEELISHREEAL